MPESSWRLKCGNREKLTGKPIGTQTFRIAITGGEIVDRRRAEDDDTSDSENYEPV